MRSMLFCFQKSVALVLTEILKSKNDSSDELRISTGSEKKAVADPEDVVWTKELGFGHGRHLPVANRKYGFLDSPIGMGVRARTMEDFDPTYINRDYRSSTNLSRLSVDSPISTSYTAENLPINHSEPIMISMSPAIPIMFRQKDQENDNLYRGEKLAGSYVEPVAESTKLENIARSLGLSGSEGDESSDGDLEESDQSDTGDNES